MFLKKIFCVVALMTLVYGGAPISASKSYVFENLKQLDQLIEKKKSAKKELQLEILFNEYVDDARKLLQSWDQHNTSEQQNMKREDTVKQIAHYMAALQKLLAIMNSNEQKPLESFCNYHRSDILWGSLCGDRPVKRVTKRDDLLKKSENDQKNPQRLKMHCADSDEIPIITGQE